MANVEVRAADVELPRLGEEALLEIAEQPRVRESCDENMYFVHVSARFGNRRSITVGRC